MVKETHSSLAATLCFILPDCPALASLKARLFRRASFSSNPACFAVPESSNASTRVSARVLYACVLRIGSVVEAIVDETAAEAREIYTTVATGKLNEQDRQRVRNKK